MQYPSPHGNQPRHQPPVSRTDKTSFGSSTVLVVVLASGGVVVGLGVLLLIVAFVIGSKQSGQRPSSSAHETQAVTPPPSGWPMTFRAVAPDAEATVLPASSTDVFSERYPDGTPQRILVAVHAPTPFLAAGMSSVQFEVCKLDHGERSRFHCNPRHYFVDPAATKQQDASRSYTIDEGPGTYEGRLVEYGTFGSDDKLYSSATFEVH